MSFLRGKRDAALLHTEKGCSCLSFEGRGMLLSFIQRREGDDALYFSEEAMLIFPLKERG